QNYDPDVAAQSSIPHRYTAFGAAEFILHRSVLIWNIFIFFYKVYNTRGQREVDKFSCETGRKFRGNQHKRPGNRIIAGNDISACRHHAVNGEDFDRDTA